MAVHGSARHRRRFPRPGPSRLSSHRPARGSVGHARPHPARWTTVRYAAGGKGEARWAAGRPGGERRLRAQVRPRRPPEQAAASGTHRDAVRRDQLGQGGGDRLQHPPSRVPARTSASGVTSSTSQCLDFARLKEKDAVCFAPHTDSMHRRRSLTKWEIIPYWRPNVGDGGAASARRRVVLPTAGVLPTRTVHDAVAVRPGPTRPGVRWRAGLPAAAGAGPVRGPGPAVRPGPGRAPGPPPVPLGDVARCCSVTPARLNPEDVPQLPRWSGRRPAAAGLGLLKLLLFSPRR